MSKHAARHRVLQVSHWTFKNTDYCVCTSRARSKACSSLLLLAAVFLHKGITLPCSKTKCCALARWCSKVPGGSRRRDMNHSKIKSQNDPQCNFKCTRCSFTNYSLVVTPKTLPPAIAGAFPQALARSTSSCSDWNAHSFGERLQLLPAMNSTPAKLIRQADAIHTGTRSFHTGCSHGVYKQNTLASSQQANSSQKHVVTTIQGDRTFKSHVVRLI